MDICFVGAGNIARSHLNNLDAIEGASVVGICDLDEDRAREAAEPRGAAVYAEYETMYDAEEPDAVYVAIPPFAHDRQEVAAAERGIDLFVEKPVALDLDVARRAERAIRDNGVVSQVGYTYRYDDLIETVADLAEDRTIGFIQRARFTGLPGTPWWRQKDKSGGQVVEMTTHGYDLARHLAGEVETVSANGNRLTYTDEIDFEETVSSVMRHEGGAITQITSSCAYPDAESSLQILGPEMALSVDRGAGAVTGTLDGGPFEYEGQNDAMFEEDKAFVEAVRDGDPGRTRSPYSDAVRTLELTLAVYESIHEGGPIDPSR